MSSRALRILAAVVVCGVAGFAFARSRRPSRPAAVWADATFAHVPHLRGAITLDGDSDDSGWRGPTLRTGTFVASDGVTPVHPHSEARVLWGDGFLYLNLYAADEDIRALGTGADSAVPGEDTFHLVFTDATKERVFDINPLGVLTDGIRTRGSDAPPDLSWSSHAHVSSELDGTPNDPHDNDEEWVLEVAIPFDALGLEGAAGERIALSMHRCDTLRKGPRVCGAWGERGAPKVLVLDPI